MHILARAIVISSSILWEFILASCLTDSTKARGTGDVGQVIKCAYVYKMVNKTHYIKKNISNVIYITFSQFICYKCHIKVLCDKKKIATSRLNERREEW